MHELAYFQSNQSSSISWTPSLSLDIQKNLLSKASLLNRYNDSPWCIVAREIPYLQVQMDARRRSSSHTPPPFRMGWTALCHEIFRKDRRGEVIWAHDTKITGAHLSFHPAASAQTFPGILRQAPVQPHVLIPHQHLAKYSSQYRYTG